MSELLTLLLGLLVVVLITVATGWWLYRTMEQHSSCYRPPQPLVLVRAMDPPLVRQALADFTQKSNNPLTNRSQPG